jgi:ribosomal protein L18E
MPIYRRVARRGFSNYPFKKLVVPVNLSTLQRTYKSGETVSLESLKERGVVKKRVELVKILASGEIKKKLTVKDLPMSRAAREKIEAAGGTVTGVEAAEGNEAAPQESAEEQGQREAAAEQAGEAEQKEAEGQGAETQETDAGSEDSSEKE